MKKPNDNCVKKSQCDHCGKVFNTIVEADTCCNDSASKVWYDEQQSVCYPREDLVDKYKIKCNNKDCDGELSQVTEETVFPIWECNKCGGRFFRD